MSSQYRRISALVIFFHQYAGGPIDGDTISRLRFHEVVQFLEALNAASLGSLAACRRDLRAESAGMVRTYQALRQRLFETHQRTCLLQSNPLLPIERLTLAEARRTLDRIENVDVLGRSALVRAVEKGLLYTVKSLMALGVDLNARGQDGRTSLLIAIGQWHDTMANALIAGGASVNARDRQTDDTPLISAVIRNPKVVQQLLQAKANVNDRSDWGSTALWWAAKAGRDREGVVRQLLEARADPTIVGERGTTPAQVAESNGAAHIAQLIKEASQRV
jgi:serine/threonine-protein phosphatase 6 regulatory ankyrin repeat subunit B